MISMFKVISELIENIVIIHRLAINDLITKNKGNFFGVLWLWVNPIIQIILYWIIFGSLRNRAPVKGVEFFLWLSCGYILWNYISSVITPGSRSIVAKMGLITKMQFKVSMVPAIIVLSELYIHIMLVVTFLVILIISGGQISIMGFQVIYYMIATTLFLYAVSIFNSAITTVIRDYQHVVYNIMRALFFFTPVVYLNDKDDLLGTIMKFNPITYLMEGYREALLYHEMTTLLSLNKALYFWGITLIFFFIGSILHMRMRKNLLDHA